MSTVRASIDDGVETFILAQHMFFVGTAPSGDGHVNISPKGLPGSFVVLGPLRVAYLDLTGSGAETIAHLRADGRICIMFCAFDGPPRIVRLHGHGAFVTREDPGFAELAEHFPDRPGARAVIVVEVDRVSDSCGFAVPLMEHVGDRDQLVRWAANRGDEGLETYRRQKNAVSIDGLPALGASRASGEDR